MNMCLHGPSQVDSPPNTRLSSSETKWKKRCRLQGPTKDEGFHTEHKDEATEYWEGAGRELHWALLERRAWSVHTRCTHINEVNDSIIVFANIVSCPSKSRIQPPMVFVVSAVWLLKVVCVCQSCQIVYKSRLKAYAVKFAPSMHP